MSEWQPIETAPKDGTEVLVYAAEDHYITKAEFFDNHWRELSYEGYGQYLYPTYWMPIPDPPRIET